MSRPPNNEYRELAAQLGITRYHAQKIGLYECRRLLSMDESARKLVMGKKTESHAKRFATPERMMQLASRKRA